MKQIENSTNIIPIYPTMLIITLNINSINIPISSERLSELILKNIQLYVLQKQFTLNTRKQI